MNTSIKFVYFDVGGVAILDFSKTNKWQEMIADLNIPMSKINAFNKLFGEMENLICKGMDLDEFVVAVQDTLGLKFPKNYSFLEDFVNRFEINKSIHPIIQYVKLNYKVGLLTNMYPKMLELIIEHKLLPNIDWDLIIDSSVIGFMKPEEEIFILAEELAGSKAESILFVENSQKHIEAANKRGWKTFQYDPADTESSSKELFKLLKKLT